METLSNVKNLSPRQIDGGTIDMGYDGAVRTWISGTITPDDGSEPYEAFPPRQGHSFTKGWIQALYVLAGGRRNFASEYVGSNGSYVSSSYDFSELIASHTPGTTARIVLVSASSNNLDEQWVQISEATHSGGTPSALNGQEIYLNYITTNTFDCYLDAAKTIPLDTSSDGVYDASSGGIWHWRWVANMHFNDTETLESPVVRLGLSADPVHITDFQPSAWSRHLYLGGQTQARDQPVVSATLSYLRLTRDFINSSGSTITVEEMVVMCNNSLGNDDGLNLIARDLQTIVVPTASTLTLNYDIETTIDIAAGSATLGGITQWFNECLYRQFTNVARNVTDLFNVSRSAAQLYSHFMMMSSAGDQRMRAYAGSNTDVNVPTAHLGGPVLGTDPASTLVVAQDNYDLGTRIEHGRGPGELYHFGSTVDDLEIRAGAWGSVLLTGGGSGSVDGITVNGVQVMSGAEAFDTDLTTTATNVAANITAHTSSPDYTAVAVGRLITIKAGDTTGSSSDGFAVVSATTTITSTDTNLADGDSAEFKVRRLFKNESGEDIVVQEIGLVGSILDSTTGYWCLLARHIHDGASGRPASTTIAHGEVVEVVITVRADV